MTKNKILLSRKLFIVSNEMQLKIWKKIKFDYEVITSITFIERILKFIYITLEKPMLCERREKLVILNLLPKTNLNVEILENFLLLLDKIHIDENDKLFDQVKEMSENQQKLFLIFKDLFLKWQKYLIQNNLIDKMQFLKDSIEKIKNFSHRKTAKLFPDGMIIEVHESVSKIFPEISQLIYSF